jgi:hypothetical protein
MVCAQRIDRDEEHVGAGARARLAGGAQQRQSEDRKDGGRPACALWVYWHRFCVPPFFDQSADAAADLPGPGAAMIEAQSILLP